MPQTAMQPKVHFTRLKKFRYADMKVHASLSRAVCGVVISNRVGTLEISVVVSGRTPILVSVEVLYKLGALISFTMGALIPFTIAIWSFSFCF